MNQTFLENFKDSGIFVRALTYTQIKELNLKLPTIQRIKVDEKVTDIVEYQLQYFKNNATFNYLGVITIMFCEEDESWYLIDGQHRFSSLKSLWETYSHKPISYFQFVKARTIDELKHNYEMINKNTPLPEFSATIDKTVPERCYLLVKREYPNMWASGTRTHRPFLNPTHFQNALGYITEYLNITVVEDIMKLIREQNDLMREDYWDFPDKKTISQQMRNKCKTSGLYLGLYKKKNDTYIYKWVKLLVRHRKKLITSHSANPFNAIY